MRGFEESRGYTTRIYYDGYAKTFTQRVVANSNLHTVVKKKRAARRKKAFEKPDEPADFSDIDAAQKPKD